MKKILLFLFILVAPVMLQTASAQSGFPFFRSFLDGKTDDIKFPAGSNGRVNSTNESSVTNRGLILTTQTSQVGAFFLPNHLFTTSNGMLIEFEYMMYYTDPPGSGNTRELTDGICMFLVDATNGTYIGNNLRFGADGAGFGYTNRYSFNSSYNQLILTPGIKGGYLAVALDQGPFKTIRMDGTDIRNGIPYGPTGIPGREITSTKDVASDTRSNVTIRGAAGRNAMNFSGNKFTSSLPEGNWGYPVLVTRHTGGSEDLAGKRNTTGFVLNATTGEYDASTFQNNSITPTIEKPFDIAGGSDFGYKSNNSYRKVIIALTPNSNEDGFHITVTIQHGSEKTVVIDGFSYVSDTYYMENAIPSDQLSGWPTAYKSSPKHQLNVTTPERLAIGFTASTGTVTNYTNVIKNLRITMIGAAESVNDIIENHRRGPVTILPLENDLAYKSTLGEPSKENIDPDSFRFRKDEEIWNPSDNPYELITSDGKWLYDPDTKEVMFFPIQGFKGIVTAMYDVNSLEHKNDDNYRSSIAKIIVDINDYQPN